MAASIRGDRVMDVLIVISGPIGVGKSEFGKSLELLFEFNKISTRNFIREQTGCAADRRALQEAGDELDRSTGGTWVAEAVQAALVNGLTGASILLDSARTRPQVEALRTRFPGKVFHVHLHAELEVLERRYVDRKPELKEFATYAEAAAHGTEAAIGSLAGAADVVLDADHVDPETLAVTAMALCGRKQAAKEPLVDVIVGGQYGSEGKGNVCAHIAQNYRALMRIGGPNAGHRVADPDYKYVQLPSGTGSNPGAKILIGAGSTLWLPQLFLEIMEHSLKPDRLVIDPQAVVIDDTDRRAEQTGLVSIATTGQGVGAASARKILNRGETPLWGPPVTMARDVKQLKPYVRSVRSELQRLFRQGAFVLLEGTQGTLLSVHHGFYPYVTSRETSAAGCLADAGISPGRVRRVIMVVRTYPIRVGGKSGWMGREIDFAEVERRSGVPVSDLLETEKGTVSGRLRRVAEFDWANLLRAAEMNGATEIALTFADYLGIDNRKASSFSDLNEATQEFIRKVERVSGVPVTLVAKAFAKDGVLDRGSWC